MKISLLVWSEFLVNSVKIDGDDEATDFDDDEVENVFICQNDKTIQSFRHLAFFSE